MKRSILILLCLALIGCGNEKKQEQQNDVKEPDHQMHSENKSDTVVKTKSLSPHTSVMAMINDAHIHIDYSSPGVRDRIIFGGLVGYNTVWQAGAHKATWIETNKDLKIDGKVLPAGKYGFFVVPGKETWKVMFNSNWDQHGKDEYSEAEDVLVTTVTPEKLASNQEALTYMVEDKKNNEGIISLAWEKLKIEIPFQVLKK
jgi:hypothetical protein